MVYARNIPQPERLYFRHDATKVIQPGYSPLQRDRFEANTLRSRFLNNVIPVYSQVRNRRRQWLSRLEGKTLFRDF